MGYELNGTHQVTQPIEVFYTPVHRHHRPGFLGALGGWRPSRDDPARIDRLVEALNASGLVTMEPPIFGLEPIRRVHDCRYLDFLMSAHQQWSATPGTSQEVHANVFAMRKPVGGGYPSSIVGRSAYHFHDQLAPIGPHTWEAAIAAANLAVAAAEAVMKGASCSYAVCRPPGHHAYSDMAGGGTYLNNAAIATEHLRGKFARIAILDLDVHHGNGTQDIFWRRPDVLFVSLHRHPEDYHPFFTGYAGEIGEGTGEGFTINVPLAAGSSDTTYLRQLEFALKKIVDYAPEAVVVSLGLDAHENDPAKGLLLSDAGFAAIGRLTKSLNLPTVLIQEGGYNPDQVGSTLLAFLSEWLKNGR